jgi:hypothetical protein
MIKALKVTMIVYGVIGILVGLAMVFFNDQLYQLYNVSALSDLEIYMFVLIGLLNIGAAVFLIMASRDPVKNILWVKFAIVWALFWVVTVIYGLVRGYVDFSQEGAGLIINAIFAVLFLVFYPWRAAEATE